MTSTTALARLGVLGVLAAGVARLLACGGAGSSTDGAGPGSTVPSGPIAPVACDALACKDAGGQCLDASLPGREAGPADALGICAWNCNGANCGSAGIVCPPGMACSLVCNGPGACPSIDCSRASACAIHCNGAGVCKRIECRAKETCTSVFCNGAGSCQDVCCSGASCPGLSYGCDAGS